MRSFGVRKKSQLAEHLKNRKPGEKNPLQEPLKFAKKALASLNPTERGLKPEEMIGRTFLLPPTADGSRHRAKIMSKVREMKDKAHADPEFIKFKCLVNNLVALSPGIPREFLVPTSLPREIALFPGNPLPPGAGKNLGMHSGNRGSASPRHG